MAIKKKFGVSGKTSGAIAFETGKGQRRERDLRVRQAQDAERRRQAIAENARQEALTQRQSEVKQRREDTAIARQDRIDEIQSGREFQVGRDVFDRAGRVEDLEFGRESTSIAGREAAERQAREFALAAKHKEDGDERQYTVEQQRKKDAINSSRVKIEEGISNGTYTQFQAEQLNQQLDALELGVSKMWGPKKITPQDELQSRTFTADNGTLMYIDGAGKVQAYPGQLTPQEKLEAVEKKETQEYEWEQDRQKAEFEVKKAENDTYLALRKEGLTHTEATKDAADRFAAPVQVQSEQEKLAALIQLGIAEGKTEDEVLDDYEAAIRGTNRPEEVIPQADAELTKEEFLQSGKKASSGSTGGVDKGFFSRGTRGDLGGFRGGI
jgi:hypothetical protein